MLKKSSMLLIVAAILAFILLGTAGCGKSGSRFANQLPTIRITSYEGYDPSSDIYNIQDTLVFQQRIYWNAEDSDGTITGYAYRVLDANGQPISTPGNKYFDADGSNTPQNVISSLGTGWVLHYKAGADQNIPLDNPQAGKTIWTTRKYAVINFPSAGANGEQMVKTSKFEVIAIDNRGDVTPVPASRYYSTWSAKPTCNVQTTKGDPRGGQVGTGIRMSFSMSDFDPFLSSTPWYYEFKINKRQGIYTPPSNENTVYDDSINPIISTTNWVSTYGTPRINQFLLTLYTDPAISNDFNANGVQVTHTEVVARVYDLAGIVSDTLKYRASDGAVIGKTSVRFAVKQGFKPKTVVYPQKTYGLGDNHFVDYQDEGTLEIYPFTIVGGSQRYATPLFRDLENTLTAVNSANFKAWIRWGWWGEYARVLPSGASIPMNDPYEKKVDAVLDGATNLNYYSEITHFDIRFNGEPYNFPPLAHNIITDAGTGKRWLRIPLNSPLGQTVVLTTLPSGTHTFEVRAVDLQGEFDPNPATFTFTLVDLIPAAQRQGVLIVDDDAPHASFSPQEIVQQKYEHALADYSGQKIFVIRNTESNPGNTNQDQRSRHLAFSDLQKYRLVIHHSDSPNSQGTLPKDHDGLYLYLINGGNLLISGTHLMATQFNSMVGGGQFSFMGHLGLGPVLNASSSLLGNNTGIQNNAFMQKAKGEAGFSDIYVQYQDPNDLTNYPNAAFNTVVNSRRGLSAVAFFNTFTGNPIYRLGCKPTDYVVAPPTQAQFDQFNNKPVAIKTVTGQSKVYLFGFPLSYMDNNTVKTMMNKVLSEVM